MKKRCATDRDRTTREIAIRLAKVHPINPVTEDGLFELYNSVSEGSPPQLLASDLVTLEILLKVVTKGLAYKAVDLYYILKYTTNIDNALSRIGAGKWSYRAGPDTTGARPTFTRLWKHGYIRKFAKGFFSPGAGGRPYKVHYQIW